MDLLVLGCQAGMAASGQASSGYLVTAGGCRILLDCGPGVAGV
jgi:ribonuclease BN (tRNA processing enzyme)